MPNKPTSTTTTRENIPRGVVSVYGRNIIEGPMLESQNISMMVVRDIDGGPVAVLVRILSNDTWGLSTRGDEDFNAVLTRYGLTDDTPAKGVEDVIK